MIVTRVTGLVTIQDLGRPGLMHEALPRGGALVPELLVAANRCARNPDHAPALEIMGAVTVHADEPVLTSEGMMLGDLVVESGPRRVAYLAVRGGIAAPLVLGGRGTQLSAGIGALVRTHDVLEIAGEREVTAPPLPPRLDQPIRVIPGPDLDAFEPGALDRLAATAWRISPTSDRVGTRLDGPALPRRPFEGSHPMVRGAIEVPADGTPIVLGPEHPTTGGYPVLAVIAHADLGQFFATRLGAAVTFWQLEQLAPGRPG